MYSITTLFLFLVCVIDALLIAVLCQHFVFSVRHMLCTCAKDGGCSKWNVHHLPIIASLVVLFVMSCMINFVQFLYIASTILWLFVENYFMKFIFVNTCYNYKSILSKHFPLV